MAKTLAQLKKELGLTNKALSEKLNISERTMAGRLAEDAKYNEWTLDEIATLSDMAHDDLILSTKGKIFVVTVREVKE